MTPEKTTTETPELMEEREQTAEKGDREREEPLYKPLFMRFKDGTDREAEQ